ncbi:hypothetical protein CDAR_381791 [Caerostris darwini]|uniref:Uncharacterized protein n=1 Tax=Caerostris darwini TaxID=1538125 RepID=A0AAV4V5M8_9ARAC|nr:hypothetical protein CDAR_381791 [Caerostris darwini]
MNSSFFFFLVLNSKKAFDGIASRREQKPLILENATLRPLPSNEKDLTIPFVPAGAISFLKCIFSQCSSSVPLPSIAKWRRTEKKEEIEQNPRFFPSFHSPTLIPTSPLFSIGSLKEEEEKGAVFFSAGGLGSGARLFLLSFLSVDNQNDCGFLFGGHPTQFLLLVSSRW